MSPQVKSKSERRLSTERKSRAKEETLKLEERLMKSLVSSV